MSGGGERVALAGPQTPGHAAPFGLASLPLQHRKTKAVGLSQNGSGAARGRRRFSPAPGRPSRGLPVAATAAVMQGKDGVLAAMAAATRGKGGALAATAAVPHGKGGVLAATAAATHGKVSASPGPAGRGACRGLCIGRGACRGLCNGRGACAGMPVEVVVYLVSHHEEARLGRQADQRAAGRVGEGVAGRVRVGRTEVEQLRLRDRPCGGWWWCSGGAVTAPVASTPVASTRLFAVDAGQCLQAGRVH